MLNSKTLTNKKVVISLLAIMLLFFSMKFFEKNQMMTGACSSAYLSGAANWSIGESWRVNYDEMDQFEALDDENRLAYRFEREDNAVEYSHNAIGLLHINALSRSIFFWQGDLQSIISLQQLTHIFLSLFILFLLKSHYHQLLFYFLYVINPVILYFVDFPYYYFWQVIPSALWLMYLLNNKLIKNKIYLLSILFAFIFIVRPSTLFLLLAVLGYIGYKEGKVRAILSLLLFFVVIFGIKPEAKGSVALGPWHTIYVGIGAYQNQYNIDMKDSTGYKIFEKETGKEYVAGCRENKNIKLYLGVLKERYINVLSESPLLLARNALLNILESYGIGYKVNMMSVNYMSAFLGFILILFLLYFREYFLFFIIGFSSISFTPYFPPIGAYMFGSYILIVYAWLIVGTRILNKIRRGDV